MSEWWTCECGKQCNGLWKYCCECGQAYTPPEPEYRCPVCGDDVRKYYNSAGQYNYRCESCNLSTGYHLQEAEALADVQKLCGNKCQE